ncbi:MAG: oligosaccharide flippase family protein [Candidatus Odinarchaeota archaeon]|nr:oligosaccharide flippase family protein [Candidatus Odinarchaeota archaeon]
MDEEILRSARITVKSGATLALGRMISTIISFVTIVFVIRFLGEEQYGLYGLALVPISMVALFRDWGIPQALTKYIAEFKAKNNLNKAKKLVTSALLFVIFTSILLTVITFILATPIATFYRKPEVASLIRIVSLVLLAEAIYKVAWNIFLGLEDTKYNVTMLVLFSTIKGGLALSLVLMGFGVLGAIIGYVIGYFASAILGIILVFRKIPKYEEKPHKALSSAEGESSWKNTLAILLSFGLPLAIANTITGFGNQFYNLLAGRYCSKWDFGNYGAAATLLTPLPVLALPISAVMFPAYSKIDGIRENKLLGSVFKLSVKYVSLLIVPVTVLIMGLSEPLNAVIFNSGFPDAPLYLTLLASIYLSTVIGYLNAGSLLRGQGLTKTVLIVNCIGLLIGIPISLFIIPLLGIVGLIFTNIAVIYVIMGSYLVFIKRKFGFSIEWKCSIKILLAGLCAGFTAYLLQKLLNSYPVVELILGGFAGLGVYFLLVLVSGAVTMEDIQNLKAIFRGIHPLRRVLKPYAKKIEVILERILE